MNTTRTWLLMAGLIMLFVWIGGLLGGRQGMIIALVIALAMNGVSYWFSDRIVLRLYRAERIDAAAFPKLHSTVHALSQQAGIPAPAVFLVPSAAPNAFATGRDPAHAAVAVTQGILDMLTPAQLEGVLAHEIAHIRNRDILIQTIAASLAGAVFFLARMAQFAAIFGGGSRHNSRGNPLGILVMAIIAPIAALVVQLAISRAREYGADAAGARISGRPRELASALRVLSEGIRQRPMSAASPVTAHMFIVNPLRGGGLFRLFSTHPPMDERIRRLEAMGGTPA